MISNEIGCKSSSCCHWNTWEEGEASFNGEGRCWSSIATDMCYDTAMNGEAYCENDAMISNEDGCKSSSCCHWNTWEEGEASFNGEGRCWSSITTDTCYDTQAITWQHVGHGGCADGPWRKIGTAGSADEAKALVLADDQCHAGQSMPFSHHTA